jgi:ATP-dependent Lon protease
MGVGRIRAFSRRDLEHFHLIGATGAPRAVPARRTPVNCERAVVARFTIGRHSATSLRDGDLRAVSRTALASQKRGEGFMSTRTQGTGDAKGRILDTLAAAPGATAPDGARTAPAARFKERIIFPGERVTFAENGELALRALKAAYAGYVDPARVTLSEPAPAPAKRARAKATAASQEPQRASAPEPAARSLIALYQPESAESNEHPVLGMLVNVISFEEQGERGAQVTLEGVARARLTNWTQREPHEAVSYEVITTIEPNTTRAKALLNQANKLFEKLAMLDRRFNPDDVAEAARVTEPGKLADRLAARVMTDLARQAEILLALDPLDRLEAVCVALGNEIEIRDLENKIRQKVRQQVDKNQREYYLKEQLRAIQEELGADQISEVRELRERIERKGFPDDARAKITKELDRLERMPSHSAELVVLRNYIDWMLALPWVERTEDRLDMEFAQKTLDDEHFGLEKVKERIVEFLAVRQLRILRVQERAREAARSAESPAEAAALAASATAHKGPILCLIGPPGVGKTSLGRSIAHALGREFVRISLGGVHDEAEIRGHRRTYVGALPGRIIQAMRTAGTINPVFLLDEIDKLASDYRGDPSAALLEALDPEQNSAFSDHYLETPYDLSQCFFICTGNNRHQIPSALADRMDTIEIPGYTEEEKIEIGRRFVLPKTLAEHGLAPSQVQIPISVMRAIISGYTREAGVRSLERQLATICRKTALRIVVKPNMRIRVTEKSLEQYLGAPHYLPEKALDAGMVGVATGLAWTSAGGTLLPVEVLTMPGKGGLMITGQLGDVMQESARAALSYIRSRADELDLPEEFPGDMDIHIHLPEGAIPKDGPSAGITMALAMISALTHRPVRGDIAMTGEITLRGRVLPIGGLKEKALAASRVGIHHLIIPAENDKDLAEIPAKIRAGITFTEVENMDEVIRVALTPLPAAEATTPSDLAPGQPVAIAEEPAAASAALDQPTQPHDDTPLPPDAPAEQPGGVAGV